jgi:hypothetical protein
MSENGGRLVLDAEQVAELLGTTPKQVRKLARKGSLPSIRSGATSASGWSGWSGGSTSRRRCGDERRYAYHRARP